MQKRDITYKKARSLYSLLKMFTRLRLGPNSPVALSPQYSVQMTTESLIFKSVL